MLRLFFLILFATSLRHGSCTPTRITVDGNTRELPTPALVPRDLWDTYGRQFSQRISPFDVYQPTIGQQRNFGSYATGRIVDNLALNSNFPQKSLGVWLGRCDNVNDIKRNLLLSTELGLGPVIRCRRKSQGWTVQEPLYVEEPQWLPLEGKGRVDKGSDVDEDDPFIVARGKRSNYKSPRELDRNPVTSILKTKRETLRLDGDSKVTFDTDENPINSYRLAEYVDGRKRYFQPRDKHSDIMDILSEPFFISRGKKDRSRKSDFQSNAGNLRPTRDRRGEIMEQLLKEQDPFYVARGKRAMVDLTPPLPHARM